MKKILLTLGTMLVASAPIFVVVSCGTTETSNSLKTDSVLHISLNSKMDKAQYDKAMKPIFDLFKTIDEKEGTPEGSLDILPIVDMTFDNEENRIDYKLLYKSELPEKETKAFFAFSNKVNAFAESINAHVLFK